MGKKCLYEKMRNLKFWKNFNLNELTFQDYLNRLKKVATSIFEWTNLPQSMDARFLEETLFYFGQAAFLKDDQVGFINTRVSSSGYINIYNLPTKLNCFSNQYSKIKQMYSGIEGLDKEQIKQASENSAVLVMNTWDRLPTYDSILLFALRLQQAERTIDVNINAQRTPILILTDEKQRHTMTQVYSQYEGNMPVIYGVKGQLDPNNINAIKTDAPYIADKLDIYKKQIWNEALTFLGVNNIIEEKKERLVTDEANANNELINLNLQSFLAPRQEACKQFNELFGLTGEKEINVRVRSDLKNIIKEAMSVVQDFKDVNDLENNLKEGNPDGKIYDGTSNTM